MSDNLRFWAQGAHVPPEARRDFRREGGFSGTDINTMWRTRTLTEMFGPVGLGWRFRTVRRWTETYDTGEMKAYAEIALYYRNPETGEWSEPIYGVGGNSAILERRSGRVANDECYKMAETDAFGRACMWLGIGSDVYWSQDRTKYCIDEDGNVTAHVPTDDEIRQENRQAKRQQMANDPFFKVEIPPKEEPVSDAVLDALGDDAGFLDGAAFLEAQRHAMDSVDLTTARRELAKIYRESPGSIDRYIQMEGGKHPAEWSEDHVRRCYVELMQEGSE